MLLAIIVIESIMPVMGSISNVVKNVDSVDTEYTAEHGFELQTMASDKFTAGNYAEALSLQSGALDIFEKSFGKNHIEYAIALNNMAVISERLNMLDNAIKYNTLALEIIEKNWGKDNDRYATFLSNLAVDYAGLGKYDKAITLSNESLQITTRILGKENLQYANTLHTQANYHYYKGDYATAIRIANEVLEIQERLIGKNNIEYAGTLNSMATFNDAMANYDEAIRLSYKAFEIIHQLFGTNHPNYVVGLSNLCLYYYHGGKYLDAIRYGEEALKMFGNFFPKTHPLYATILNNLALPHEKLANYQEAIRYLSEALDIQEKATGKLHPTYATILSNLASNYASLGNYAEAVKTSGQSLKIQGKVSGENHSTYLTTLVNHAYYNSKLGDFPEAIKLSYDAIDLSQKFLGKEHIIYAECISNLASYYSDTGNYAEGMRLISEALQIKKKLLGTDHPAYLTSLTNLASYHQALGNYPEALRIFTEVMTTTGRLLGEYHPDYARAVNNMACMYADYGDYTNAVSLSRKAAEIYKNVVGADHDDYAMALGNLSLYLYYAGNIEEAISIGRMSLDIRGRTLGTRHHKYAVALGNLALFTYEAGDRKQAIQLAEESLKIRENRFGKQFSECVTALQNLALFAQGDGQLDAAARYVIDANNRQSEIVRNSFSSLSSAERANYWNKTSSHYHLINRITDSHPVPEMVECGYDAVLLSKGILLSTDRDFTSLIIESGDSVALAIYDEMRLTRLRINSLREQASPSTAVNLDSLANVANNLEHRLIDRSKIFGDFTRNMAINWKDVRRCLSDSAVAVEFVDFIDNGGSTKYGAYVLSSAMSSPAYVHLFSQSALDSVRPYELYRTDKLSNLLWKPLDRFIRDARVICFSAAGNLYNIAVESLPAYDGDGLMSDRHSLYRLSSTRQLAATQSSQSVTKAALYGGMQYTVDNEVLRADAERHPSDAFRDLSVGDAALADEFRRGIQPLPGTLTEVENIRESMSHSHIDAAFFTGADATEGTFKALSGKGTGLIHIATHGFYWTREEADNRRNLSFLAAGQQSHSYAEEEKALSRSGLLFAGAQNALSGSSLPDNCNDGILTAREIATIDLRGLDLVVLSACQTGLGEISGDGVFGLQRGFKKAGARSLLMSLWKVNDFATGMLMTQFYKHCLAGKSKHEALALAQKHVREYRKSNTDSHGNVTVSHPYASPTFWAAFILLDAME